MTDYLHSIIFPVLSSVCNGTCRSTAVVSRFSWITRFTRRCVILLQNPRGNQSSSQNRLEPHPVSWDLLSLVLAESLRKGTIVMNEVRNMWNSFIVLVKYLWFAKLGSSFQNTPITINLRFIFLFFFFISLCFHLFLFLSYYLFNISITILFILLNKWEMKRKMLLTINHLGMEHARQE